jgi:hypothetical protein
MTAPSASWRSKTGDENAIGLRTTYHDGFAAMAEYDRIGHLLLYRAGETAPIASIDGIVGVALLRRAVTLFLGVRGLLEASLIDPAKPLARAYFELWLNYRCLAYGPAEPIALETPTVSEERGPRATRYYVAAQRRALRSRALILLPGSRFPPRTGEEADALRKELIDEIGRLKTTFPAAWDYFGDVTEASVIKHVGGRDELPWYAAEFLPDRVGSIGRLAEAFGYEWEYEFLYDAFSAMTHTRGVASDVTAVDGHLEVHHPHSPDWFETIAWLVMGWHGMLLMTAAKWLAPGMISDLQQLHTRHRDGIASLQPRDVPALLG